MESVTVKREDLLAKVKENRTQHRSTFEKAQEAYRKQVIAELDKMLDDAKHGRQIKRMVSLPEPEDHTKDYDRVVSMLEMSVDEFIEIDENNFDMYVLDQWSWSRSFASNTASYVSR